jgi:hypothetical protein
MIETAFGIPHALLQGLCTWTATAIRQTATPLAWSALPRNEDIVQENRVRWKFRLRHKNAIQVRPFLLCLG